jgi:hypothetical protein
MSFIADRLAQRFRTRVGLPEGEADPLLDLDVLAACRDINRYSFPDYKLPTRSPLSLTRTATAKSG